MEQKVEAIPYRLPEPSRRRFFAAYTEEVLLAGIIIAILVLGPLFSPFFASAYNLSSLTRQISFDVIPALGQLLVILTGAIDLSIGAVMRVAQLVTILLIGTTSTVVAVVVAIAVGAGIGLINGLIIVKGRLEPFIVTLGMWSALDGLSLILTGGQGISATSPDAFTALGRGDTLGVPNPTLIALLVVTIIALLVHWANFGRRIYSVGSNDLAAFYSGINIVRIRMAVFVLSGALAAVTGVLLAARTGAFQPTTISSGGAGYELATIAAVVVGGARLSGGRGTVLGTVMGAMLTGLLFNILVLASIDPYIQSLILGAIILAALLISSARRGR